MERLGVVDGEIVELDPERIECMFSLTNKALELFEEEFGKPIINVLFGKYGDDYTQNGQFIRALACSCYLKLEDNSIRQNQATKEAFKKLEIYPTLASDLQFVTELVSMAIECIEEKTKKTVENNAPVKN